MKKLLFLLFCCWPALVHSQDIQDFGFDRVRIDSPDKTIQTETKPVQSVPTAKYDLNYYWYAANQIHVSQGGFSGKLLNGSYKAYYPNKNLQEQGQFKNGLKTGEWLNWNEKGMLLTIYTWKAGKRSGNFKEFDEHGKLTKSGVLKNDLLEGRVKNFLPHDSISVTRYHHGIIIPDQSNEPAKPINQ